MLLATAVLGWSVVFTVASCSDYTRTIYVDPERGSNTETCVKESSVDQPCKNLSYVFQPQYRDSSTRYSLQPGTHYLNSTASDHPFTGLTHIAITGNASGSSSVTIFCFTENSGLSFVRVQNIAFGNVKLTNCSSKQNGTSQNVTNSGEFELLPVQTALYFSNCTNISMEGVVVTNSPNGSAVTVYNTVGTNTFTGCEFSYNSGPVTSPVSGGGGGSLSGGGGGVYVEFSYCIPGNTNCQNSNEQSSSSNNGSFYIFTDCIFTYNSATFSGAYSELSSFISHKERHLSFGLGGGLSIFLCGNATENSFLISRCNFSGNSAEIGGGFYVEFADTSSSNNVTVIDTLLSNNSCSSGRGGGANVAHFSYQDDVNSANFTGCNFTQNEALKGGGLRMVAVQQNFNLFLSGLRFDTNRGLFGGAVLIQIKAITMAERSPSILIQNCSFLCNSVHANELYSGPHEVGVGIVYVESVDVTFDGKNTFEDNKGSALALVEASANVTNTTMYFTNNFAVNGGALSLLGSAKLLIDQHTYIMFDSNRAYSKGGAIFNKYTERNTYIFTTNCFVVHQNGSLTPDEWGARFIFRENSDVLGRNAIQTTSALSCDPTQMRNLSSVFCWKNWSYQYNGQDSHDCSKYIRTAPGNITINTNTSRNGTFFVKAYPGEVTEIPISVFDDLNHTTKAIFSAIGNNISKNVSSAEGAVLDPDYTYLFNDKIRVLGTPNHSVQIDLNSVGDRNWHVLFYVNLTECPPGLRLLPTIRDINNGSNSSLPYSGGDEDWMDIVEEEEDEECVWKACVCIDNPEESLQSSVRCSSSTNASLLSGYWMGLERVDGEEEYVVSPCPSGFCQTATHMYIPLPKYRQELDEHVCGVHHRRGRVCGQCVEGHGPVVSSGSFECVSCDISSHMLSLHIFYYVLSVYVPLFLLFLIIIVFNIKLTTGPANAFILFSQVISSTLNINADNRIPLNSISPNIDTLLKAYQFPYGIFNLQFFELFVPKKHLCFGTHLNALDLLLLEYLVAFSPLLMILAIVGVYRIIGRCNWCSVYLCRLCGNKRICKNSSDRLRKSTVPAIASFILLSYTKFSLTSSLTMAPAFLMTLSGKQAPQWYFYYAGHEAFSNTENIFRYILPATLVFMTFVVIPPLLLLDYPLRLLERTLRLCPLLWRLYPSGKIHILLDAFQGCYKDRYRWFAGLYFLFRLLINLANAMCKDIQQFFIQEFFCIVFALLVLFFRPYRRRFYLLNYFDSLIFLNLAVINLITLYLYVSQRRVALLSVLLFSVQYILVLLPLVYMVVYVMWRVLPIPRVRTRVREWLETRRHNHQMENLIQNGEKAETPDNVDWERARAINCYKPVRSPEGPLHSSISRPTSHTLTHSTTHHQPSEGERGSGKDYGSTGRSDSGIAAIADDLFEQET